MILGGRQRVQGICDFVHAKIRFSYPDARPTRSASGSMHEGIGVCRDFAHLAIALCRCMNIPARYCTGYLALLWQISLAFGIFRIPETRFA
jgi:transglutaminase-like putative cysteine protease